MQDIPMYHAGSRQLQDEFATRKLADRLVDVYAHATFTDEDRTFIQSLPCFFLASADAEGRPDCSYKGGLPGFVRVVEPGTLAFPVYDGNGMFKSSGNVLVNPHVGLLFIDFENARRLRVNGRASVSRDDPLLAEYAGAQMIVRVDADAIFPNCPRYVHRMLMIKPSRYVPRENVEPPVPAWKHAPEFRDVMPPGAAVGDAPRESVSGMVKSWVKRAGWKLILRMRG